MRLVLAIGGNALLRRREIPDAKTQGLIGFWLQQALGHAGLAKDVVVLVSRTLVDSTAPRLWCP